MKKWIILVALVLCSDIALAQQVVIGNKGYVVGKPPEAIQAEQRNNLIDQALNELSTDRKTAEVTKESSQQSARNLSDIWAGIKRTDEWINKNWW